MTNNQLFIALLATTITLLGLFYKMLKDYFDAKIDGKFEGQHKYIDGKFDGQQKYMDARFTSIDNQLKFLLDHFVDHETRISKLEAK